MTNFEQPPSFPALQTVHYRQPTIDALRPGAVSTHPPRILMLYGSLRKRSFSRLLTHEATRLLQAMGAEVRICHADGLPLPDATGEDHTKVAELRALSA